MEIPSKKTLIVEQEEEGSVVYLGLFINICPLLSVQVIVGPHFSPSLRLSMPCDLCWPMKCEQK